MSKSGTAGSEGSSTFKFFEEPLYRSVAALIYTPVNSV
jgi:hypothetical protein